VSGVRRSLVTSLLLVVFATTAAGVTVALRYEPFGACPGLFERRTMVEVGDNLQQALDDAEPGDVIELADGIHRGTFDIRHDGEAGRPITLCGRRAAIIEGPRIVAGTYGLHIRADHWALIGFTVRNHSKGIVMDGSNHLVLRGLEVYDIGGEGIRFRAFSSDNLLTESWVHDTGLTEPENGEGVYVGTAVSQWCRNTDCEPDTSDRNRIIANVIGPRTTAESIDIKEGTSGGLMADNVLDGAGMTETDSWVDVKGNHWTITGNRGSNAPVDGFQTHLAAEGWGNDNRFVANTAVVDGPGYGINIDVRSEGNVVTCDNVVREAGSGLSNVLCVSPSVGARPATTIAGLAASQASRLPALRLARAST
jgi:hypothetical protein